jgi:cytoskeletal protein CcmA (bactofilin family)
MAFSSFRSRRNRFLERDEPATQGMESGNGTAARSEPLPEPVPSYSRLDAGCRFEGSIRSPGEVRLAGWVEGEVDAAHAVNVEAGGEVSATITSAAIVVSGRVEGDLSATGKITLHSSARVKGDLLTRGIVIEEGAGLEGSIRISS